MSRFSDNRKQCNFIRYLKATPLKKRKLLRNPVNVYLILLFSSDLVHAIGQGMNAKWVYDGVVYTGAYCTAQGITRQVGETGGALATLAIAVHTFIVLFTRKGHDSRTTAICIVLSICVFLIGFVLGEVGKNGATRYITPTPYWCWISSKYASARIWGQYVWLWVTLGVSIAVYVPIFLWNRGNLSVDNESWWKVTFYWRPSSMPKDRGKSVRNRPGLPALAILAYPLIYSILILPFSVVRWITFTHHTVPPIATFIAAIFYGFSGLFNVILLLSTRQQLLLFGNPDCLTNLDDSSTHGAGRPPYASSIAGSFTSRDHGDGHVQLSNIAGSGHMNNGRLASPSESGWNTPRTSQELP
ncbi:hypothetical protein BD410DRAFT_805970 [Rickenella mellea]|uniref:Uncharacterized protein n=1 Tax=Rickenella mellea TaxID=50990 RepID=A0A4Y7PUV8_9AGAM|nr:hypothetical protein BD410DRAFT_805970 [Rickenella mellea]